jgi:MFS family permease
MCRYPSLRWLVLLLGITQLNIFFIFYSPTLMLADLDFDIYVSGVVLGLGSTVSVIFSYFTIGWVGRKTMTLFSFGIIFIMSFALIFLWQPKGSGEVSSGGAFNLVAFFVITFMINNEITIFTVYLTEVLPTQARVIGYGVVLVFGNISVVFADLIITLCKNSGFSVMIIFAICSFVSMLVSFKLP